MKNLNENKFDAEVNIFDIHQLYESVIRFIDDLKKSYNVLSKDINKFVKNFPDVRKHICEFTKLAYVITGKSVDGRICRLPDSADAFYKIKQLQSATHELDLLVDCFVKEVDKFIDWLYDNEAFDKFDEEKADELSSLSCSLSLSFASFHSWVRKL